MEAEVEAALVAAKAKASTGSSLDYNDADEELQRALAATLGDDSNRIEELALQSILAESARLDAAKAKASTGSSLEVRREQLRQQPLPAARHVHFSVSEDSRPRSSSRLSARTQQSDATEVSEEDVPLVSPVRALSLFSLHHFLHS